MAHRLFVTEICVLFLFVFRFEKAGFKVTPVVIRHGSEAIDMVNMYVILSPKNVSPDVFCHRYRSFWKAERL